MVFRVADWLDWVSRSSQENAKSNLFVKSQLVRAVDKSEGFVFSSKGPVNRVVNSLLHDIIISKGSDKNELSWNVLQEVLNFLCPVQRCLKTEKNKKFYPISTQH